MTRQPGAYTLTVTRNFENYASVVRARQQSEALLFALTHNDTAVQLCFEQNLGIVNCQITTTTKC